jgi:GTPase SAR1 family protein
MEDFIEEIWVLYGFGRNPFSLDCFVGREDQIRQLGRILSQKGDQVYGDIGVGKTSLVNIIRHHVTQNGYFTPLKEIAIRSDWKPDDFIFNTLAGIFATLQVLKEKPISNETYSKLETLIDVGFSDTNSSLDFFTQVCQEIVKKTNHDIIIHYNNVELLSEKEIKELFENLRDFFQIQGANFVFVDFYSLYAASTYLI